MTKGTLKDESGNAPKRSRGRGSKSPPVSEVAGEDHDGERVFRAPPTRRAHPGSAYGQQPPDRQMTTIDAGRE